MVISDTWRTTRFIIFHRSAGQIIIVYALCKNILCSLFGKCLKCQKYIGYSECVFVHCLVFLNKVKTKISIWQVRIYVNRLDNRYVQKSPLVKFSVSSIDKRFKISLLVYCKLRVEISCLIDAVMFFYVIPSFNPLKSMNHKKVWKNRIGALSVILVKAGCIQH